MTVMLQPDTGNEGAPLPYPFFVSEAATGEVGRQDFWRGSPARVIGFTSKINRQVVDLPWATYVADGDLDAAVGMYIVTADVGGGISTVTIAPVGKAVAV